VTEPLATTIGKAAPPPLGGGGRAHLHLVFPPTRAPAAIALERTPLVLGRQAGPGAYAIDEGTVSRRHALVEWDAGRGVHVAVDLDSRNGSFADGLTLAGQRRVLFDGSVLRLGDVLFVYESDGDGDAADDAVDHDAVPGRAARMGALRARLQRAGRDPAPALIVGDSGTGKERIAGELHRLSGRTGPYLAINCAALSGQLIESQLFGHVKGAFTGAAAAQPGLFRAADGGTLFLDELGELPLDLQPKLLRVIQEGEVHPVGATQVVRVDVRVVAATNRVLADAVEAGSFRRDLYARLSLWELSVPPLHQRRVDILPWLSRLHDHWRAQRGLPRGLFALDADAAEAILRFSWPTNLRGLERLVHELESAGGAEPRRITRAALPAWLDTPASSTTAAPPPAAVRPPAPTREAFLEAFAAHKGSVRALARHYGRDRKQIYRWMHTFGIASVEGESGDE
jgi:transcriptional regulator with PAS, ATPase and Fis domain